MHAVTAKPHDACCNTPVVTHLETRGGRSYGDAFPYDDWSRGPPGSFSDGTMARVTPPWCHSGSNGSGGTCQEPWTGPSWNWGDARHRLSSAEALQRGALRSEAV